MVIVYISVIIDFVSFIVVIVLGFIWVIKNVFISVKSDFMVIFNIMGMFSIKIVFLMELEV